MLLPLLLILRDYSAMCGNDKVIYILISSLQLLRRDYRPTAAALTHARSDAMIDTVPLAILS